MLARLNRYKLPLVIIITVTVRLAALFAFPSIFAYTETGIEIQGSVAYDEYAQNLLATGVYGRTPGLPDAGLPPLYSYVLALIYRIFGRHFLATGIAHILFDALSIALLYDICRRLFVRNGDSIGALAGLFFALYPYLIFQNLTLNDTALWILLVHLFVWLLVLLRERETFDQRALLLAIASGRGARRISAGTFLAAALRDLSGVLVPAPLRLARDAPAPGAGRHRQPHRSAALAGAGLSDLWRLCPDRAQQRREHLPGQQPANRPIFRAGYDVQWVTPPLNAPPKEDPLRRNNFLARGGLVLPARQPGANPRAAAGQIPGLLECRNHSSQQPAAGEKLVVDAAGTVQIITGEGSHTGVTAANAAYQDSSLFNLMRQVHIVYFGGLWLLAIAGIWVSRRDWRDLSLLYFVQISQTAVYLLFHPSTRYRSPTDPLLFVFSAVAVVWLLERWRGRHTVQT